MQHENDHLDGILLLDRMSPVAKLANRRKIKDLEESAKPKLRKKITGNLPRNKKSLAVDRRSTRLRPTKPRSALIATTDLFVVLCAFVSFVFTVGCGGGR